jgi:hypothetical protein
LPRSLPGAASRDDHRRIPATHRASALVGTGAFTTVSAERSVEVSTAGDASAFLQLTADSPYVESPGDTLSINLDAQGADGNDSGFNEEAVTQLSGVIQITNNAADGSSTTVGVSTDGADSASATGSITVLVDDSDENDDNAALLTLSVSDSEGDFDGATTGLDTGQSAYLDAEVDTRSDQISSSSAAEVDTISIVAEGTSDDAAQTP